MSRLPSLFVSHGAPTFALTPGQIGAQLGEFGRQLGRPQAVLVVSPHWSTYGLRVATTAQPHTVHDFSGFDAALYRLQYPAPGHPALAARTLEVLRAHGWHAEADAGQGLDHGAWVPLLHLYPQADVPVFQVSLPARLDGAGALALGRALAPLADEGVLVVGSGSLTHNLHEFRAGEHASAPYVQAFTAWVREALMSGDHTRLQHTLEQAPHAQRAHPSAEHFWPLLVAAAAAGPQAGATPLDGGVRYGVLSMDAFIFGALPPCPAPA
jgi:4,5-DOPA dioxygenase extradiol